MKFAPGQLRFVADASTALLWEIEDRILTNGEPFDVAKATVLKQAAPTWTYLTAENRQAMVIMANSLSPADLSRSTVRELDRRWRQNVADHHAPLRWYDRLCLKLFGAVWR